LGVNGLQAAASFGNIVSKEYGMTIRFRPITEPFAVFLTQARQLLGFWGRFVAATLVISLILGPFAPLVLVAILFTVGLPILLLILWGKSLDQELGWTEIDEGPW
jgi:hypothetical protein